MHYAQHITFVWYVLRIFVHYYVHYVLLDLAKTTPGVRAVVALRPTPHTQNYAPVVYTFEKPYTTSAVIMTVACTTLRV